MLIMDRNARLHCITPPLKSNVSGAVGRLVEWVTAALTT